MLTPDALSGKIPKGVIKRHRYCKLANWRMPPIDAAWASAHRAAEDITHNRPALSRWHEDYKDAFAAFMKTKEASSD